MKRIISCITAVSLVLTCLFSLSLTAQAQEDFVFSAEYKTSPFYTKLTQALDSSRDKTAMEKTLAVALSQEGYQNYATSGIDVEQARADGLLWTGITQRMNAADTGNTEYTRWAQRYVMGRSEETQYIDLDWCAIFVSWCMFQAGYYDAQALRKYYYSYFADPRIEHEADTWIGAFNLEQENVWYAPNAEGLLDEYNWNTYHHTGVDSRSFPYKPGGLVFFSWDATGSSLDHVAIVVDYDRDTHKLTYSNGNSAGQVITRTIDLDAEEEFRGTPFAQNSNRVVAYGEYDTILPLEQKKITTEHYEILWDKGASSGLRLQTNTASKIVSVSMDGEYLGSNIESNMLLLEGKVAIGKSELVGLDAGKHSMQLAFDDGVLTMTLHVTDEKQLPAILCGDADLDGSITIADATLIQRAGIDLVSFSDIHKQRCDVNGDGKISVTDATCIQKYLAQYATGTGTTGEVFAG